MTVPLSLECGCNSEGSVDVSQTCDPQTGKCNCKENIAGDKCDRCGTGFYDFPNCKGKMDYKIGKESKDKKFHLILRL